MRGNSSRASFLGLRPPLADAHDKLHELVWKSGVPAPALELCRLRMARLLGCGAALEERSEPAIAAGLTETKIERLAHWPTDALFDTCERACIEFAELFVIDQHAITEQQAAAVRIALGEAGFVAFTTALSIWENQHRLDNAIALLSSTSET